MPSSATVSEVPVSVLINVTRLRAVDVAQAEGPSTVVGLLALTLTIVPQMVAVAFTAVKPPRSPTTEVLIPATVYASQTCVNGSARLVTRVAAWDAVRGSLTAI